MPASSEISPYPVNQLPMGLLGPIPPRGVKASVVLPIVNRLEKGCDPRGRLCKHRAQGGHLQTCEIGHLGDQGEGMGAISISERFRGGQTIPANVLRSCGSST